MGQTHSTTSTTKLLGERSQEMWGAATFDDGVYIQAVMLQNNQISPMPCLFLLFVIDNITTLR